MIATRAECDSRDEFALRVAGGHCQAMAPTWRDLGEAYANDVKTVIAEVDCTEESKICDRFKVQSYPTLKILQAGDSDLQDYEGEMTFESLQEATKTRVKPACTPDTRKACTAAQLKDLDAYMAMKPEERAAQYARTTAPLVAENDKLAALNDRLEKLEEKVEEQEDIVDKLKASLGPKLRLLRSTLEYTVSDPKDEL